MRHRARDVSSARSSGTSSRQVARSFRGLSARRRTAAARGRSRVRPSSRQDTHVVETVARLARLRSFGALGWAVSRNSRAIWRERWLARPAGLEPAAPCLEGTRSIQLSYGRVMSTVTQFRMPPNTGPYLRRGNSDERSGLRSATYAACHAKVPCRLETLRVRRRHHVRRTRPRAAGSTWNPACRNWPSVVSACVNRASRMITKLVQSVNEKSLSRLPEEQLTAFSKRSLSIRSHLSRGLRSICCHHVSAARKPRRTQRRERFIDNEIGRQQGLAGLECAIAGPLETAREKTIGVRSSAAFRKLPCHPWPTGTEISERRTPLRLRTNPGRRALRHEFLLEAECTQA
jgi:hypothetical protein